MTADNPNPDPPEKRPLRKTPPATPAVQAWLDGEADKDRLTDPDEQETAEFWSRINVETERLRRRSTPIHVQQRILSSLPDEPAAPTRPAAAGLKPVILSPSMAVVIGVALVGIGVLIGVLFLGG